MISRTLLARVFFFALSGILFAMDRGTKALVVRRLPLYDSIPVVDGLFHLTHVANTGALFGLLAGLPPPFRGLVFITVPLVAILLILIFQFRSPKGDLLIQTGLSLILGGALGNLYDRIRFGHVVDFLDFSLAGYHWPAFNIADSCICLGVFALMMDLYRRESRPSPTT
jgi:signal peptidase II